MFFKTQEPRPFIAPEYRNVQAPTGSPINKGFGQTSPALSNTLLAGNIASTGLSIFAQLQAGKAQSRTAKFESEMLKLRGKQENIMAREQALLLKKQVQRNIGRAQALFASSGVSVEGGSSQRAIEQAFIEQNQDVDTLLSGGAQKQREMGFAATSRRIEGGMAMPAAFMGVTNTISQSLLNMNLMGLKGGN